MRSWVFRNRAKLERVYGSPSRPRPLTEPDERTGEDPRAGTQHGKPRRLVIYHMTPPPPPHLRQAG